MTKRKPNEDVALLTEAMARQFKRADPAITEAKKLRCLVLGVKGQLFAGMVRNPQTMVQVFIKEAAAIESDLYRDSTAVI